MVLEVFLLQNLSLFDIFLQATKSVCQTLCITCGSSIGELSLLFSHAVVTHCIGIALRHEASFVKQVAQIALCHGVSTIGSGTVELHGPVCVLVHSVASLIESGEIELCYGIARVGNLSQLLYGFFGIGLPK